MQVSQISTIIGQQEIILVSSGTRRQIPTKALPPDFSISIYIQIAYGTHSLTTEIPGPFHDNYSIWASEVRVMR